MVTIRDIAEACGVSVATVSNYLNGKNKMSAATQERIREAVERYGYQPNVVAKGLRSRKSGIIGIIVEDISQFTSPEIVEGVMRYIEDQKYQAVVKNLRLYARWSDTWFNNESMIREVLEPALTELRSMMVDGIIYIAVHGRMTRILPDDLQVPAVMIYATEENASIPSIVLDDENAAYEAVSYLIDHGHRRIGVMAGREDNLHTVLRLKGARRAMEAHDLALEDELVLYADWSREDAEKKAKKLLKKDITAVFCMADRMAGGVYDVLNGQGRHAGADLSVMGFDNQDMAAYFLPGLTTMALPLHELGEKAARLMTHRLKTQAAGFDLSSDETTIRIPCHLVERDSVRDIS